MDPITQTNATAQGNPPAQWTPITDANVVIAGAFWGTLPTPSVVSDTMPAFSFDQDDFWGTSIPTPITPWHEKITDPFAGWIESLQQIQPTNSPTTESVIVDAMPTTETISTPIIPEWTISLDSLEDTSQDISFDLPKEEIVSNDISFDLPWNTNKELPQTQNITVDTIPAVIQEDTTEKIVNIPDNTIKDTEIEDTKTEDMDNASVVTEATDTPETTKIIDDSIPVQSIGESRDDTTHDLQESYEEFKQAFDTYSTFKNNTSLTLTGLRTDEDEINYTFSQTSDHTISISKSNTTDILSFEETESGLKVILNNDSIWYYGVEQVETDTTHYLKEKIGKFTIMLESEYEKEEKKHREWIKKIKDTLKSF